MKTFTNADIRKWGACYDPIKYLKDDEQHTVLTIIDRKDIPFEDRLWCIARTDLVSEKLMRLFAVWCARQVQHLMKDERSLKALDVAEAFANGTSSREELDAAWGDAWGAARDAAWGAARNAARDAALGTARDAAWGAARDAARGAQENRLREMLVAGIETGDVMKGGE